MLFTAGSELFFTVSNMKLINGIFERNEQSIETVEAFNGILVLKIMCDSLSEQ